MSRGKFALISWLFLLLILALMQIDKVSKKQVENFPYYSRTRIATEEPIFIPVAVKEDEPEDIALGEFTITYYCPCKRCCGKNDGITFTQVKAQQGVTVAVDPDKIPLGTELYIEGLGTRIAQDIGGAIKGNHIDVFVQDHNEALKLGKHTAQVYIKGGTENVVEMPRMSACIIGF